MHLRRLFVCTAGLFLVAFVAGCGPTDPLDLKVRARDADDFIAWSDKNSQRLPEGIAQEYNKALALIQQTSPRGSSRDPNPGVRDGTAFICQKIDGRTVRQIIVLGYEIANSSLQRSISNEIENAKRTLERADKSDSNEASKLNEKAGRQMKMVEAMRAQIATNQELIARYTAKS